MKLSTIAALGALVAAPQAFASHVESCELRATVQAVQGAPTLGRTVDRYTPVAAFRIDAAQTLTGSYVDCDGLVARTKLLVLAEPSTLTPGSELLLSYRHVSGETPTGIAMDETWTVVSGKGFLAWRCDQITDQTPTFAVELRDAAAGDGHYNVYVTKDGAVVASGEDVRVRYLSDHQGGMEQIIGVEGAELTLKYRPDAAYTTGTLHATVDGVDYRRPVSCAAARR